MTDLACELDFDFEGGSRNALLEQAVIKCGNMYRELGGAAPAPAPAGPSGASAPSPSQRAATALLDQLRQEVAEFGGDPEVVRLERSHFEGLGLKLPPVYDQLAAAHDFYWLRVPLILKPLDHMPYTRLKCGLEFMTEGARPVAQIVLPDKKFRKLAELSDQFELAVTESFELDVARRVASGKDHVAGQVGAKADARLALALGPFHYRLVRAEIDHSGTGSHKVFWSITGSEHIHEEEPSLLVVLRVPKGVRDVRVAAALQAYHSFRLMAASIGELVDYLAGRLKQFFKAGAPVEDTQVWDISARL